MGKMFLRTQKSRQRLIDACFTGLLLVAVLAVVATAFSSPYWPFLQANTPAVTWWVAISQLVVIGVVGIVIIMLATLILGVCGFFLFAESSYRGSLRWRFHHYDRVITSIEGALRFPFKWSKRAGSAIHQWVKRGEPS